MRTLRFIADRQRLSKDPSSDFKSIVAGSVGYLEAEFVTTGDWSGCALVAFFTDGTVEEYVPVIGNRCVIPSSVLKGKAFMVQLIGTIGDAYKIISTRDIILQKMR